MSQINKHLDNIFYSEVSSKSLCCAITIKKWKKLVEIFLNISEAFSEAFPEAFRETFPEAFPRHSMRNSPGNSPEAFQNALP